MNRRLLSSSTKFSKSLAYGFVQEGLYLAPANSSGIIDVCPRATPGCRAACLVGHSGRMGHRHVRNARLKRTESFVKDREGLLAQLDREIALGNTRAKRLGLRYAVRLNGGSDLPFERFAPWLFEKHPDVMFVEYSKNPGRAFSFVRGECPPNFHLVFSRAETQRNQEDAKAVLQLGGQVAVVFHPGLPDTFAGVRVYPGDRHDLPFLYPSGVIGLLAKGGPAQKEDDSGLVVRVKEEHCGARDCMMSS